MKNQFIAIVALWVFLFSALPAWTAGEEAKAPVFSLRECIGMAFEKNPELKTYYEKEIGAGASLNMQRAGYNPGVNFSASYGGNSTNTSGQGAFVEKKYYSGLVSLQMTVFDFGRTRYSVLAAREDLSAAHYDFLSAVNRIILGVKQDYLTVLGRQKLLEVAGETVKIQQQHLLQSENFFRVGIRSRIEVTKAEVDLANARLELIKSQNALNLARVQLNNSMGLEADFPLFGLSEEELNLEPGDAPRDAYEVALKNRPDCHRMTSQLKSLEAQVRKAQSDYNPSLSGNVSYGKSGSNFPLSDSTGYALNLTFPIFNQGITPANVSKSRAGMKAMEYQRDALKNTIYKEVRSASLNLRESREQIEVLNTTLKQAKENFELAQGRYNLGIGTNLEYQDALLSYTQAQSGLIQAQVLYGSNLAQLEYSMGLLVEGRK
jgi:outer membrane protein TolC